MPFAEEPQASEMGPIEASPGSQEKPPLGFRMGIRSLRVVALAIYVLRWSC